jgi:zinc/manganese transport system permease protein
MFVSLLEQHFVQLSLIAAAVAAIVAGSLSPLVIARSQAFSVHGIAELGLTGAAGGLLAGIDPASGALIGSASVGALLGILGLRDRDRDAATGVVLAAGLGLGALFLRRLQNNSATSGFGLLIGSIGSVSNHELVVLCVVGAVVLGILVVCWRPLWFASIDAEAAAARGVPVRTLAVAFPILLGAAVAEVIQVTGVLLILTLVVTPAAAATRLSARPRNVVAMSVGIAVLASVGGDLAALQWGSAPPSFFVAMISFVSYVVARVVGDRRRGRREPAHLAA